MQLFVLVFCILYSAVFSEPVSKRSDNEGKDSPLIWLILKQLSSLEARIEKLKDIAIENQKNIVSLKSNNGNSGINKDAKPLDDVNFKVIAVKKKIDHLTKKVDLDKSKLEEQIYQIKRAYSNMGGGDTYVRWGRTTCPPISGTKLVYSGYTGGGYYSHAGRPAEPVCLPTNPNFVKTSGSNAAYIYGTEYETNFFRWNSVQQDVPCSVCHVQFGTTIMIPGKTRCHKGWKLQYKGTLSAGAAGHGGASTYLCVNFHPQYIHGGSANTDGYLLYEVVAQCGALPCPPYRHGYPLTCVVCSK
ncbi:uncharacterized protein LOC127716308 [Mytilus californianus]|uniref:uncharacterized protein LOC127716308 n=1 Tax=Mytilus californianus TaxID=6549 RepID=UPI0022471763|nr:uncharacterized protein LOC127716308 [Mytilus californianus]